MTIEEKHNIVYYKKRHLYEIDLAKRNYALAKCKPFLLEIKNMKFRQNSWIHLVEDTANYLIQESDKTAEELLLFRVNWTTRPIFILEKRLAAHKGPLINGLYIDVNHTAVHMIFIVQEMIEYFDVSKNDCRLIVYIPHGLEKQEVREYYYQKNKTKMIQFLKLMYQCTSEKIESVFSMISSLDSHLESMSDIYKSLLLFDSRKEYATAKARIKQYLDDIFNSYQMKQAEMILDLFTKFYATYY